MKLLHFIKRDKWSFLLLNQYYLCPSEEELEEMVSQLKETHPEEELQEDSFTVCDIEDIEETTYLQLLPLASKKE